MRKLLLATAATMGALLATAGGAKAQPVKPVAPGTIVVHLNGYLQFEIADFASNFNTVAGAKLNPVTTDGDARLYAGFDAETLNGVAYGAQIELRTTTSDAGVGAGKVTGSAGSAGSESIYVKRAYGYLGTPTAGFARFGQTDSAFTLLQTGVIEAFGDGAQWNSDGGEVSLLPTNAAPGPTLVYADQSGLYATSKIVYITPTFSGLSGAVGYEPNSNGLKEGYGSNGGANSLSANLAASPTAGDIGKRRKNTIDAMVQYSMSGDGMLTKVSGGIIHGATVAYDGVPTALGTTTHFGYDDLTVYQAGAQTTFAGLTLGANIKGGQAEDGYAFKPKGARNALAYIVGASYVVGPYVIGASYFNSQTAGAYVPGGARMAKTLNEYGVAVGGNYVIGKDLSLFVQYEYAHRHQPGNTAISVRGNGQVQAIATGATFKW